MTEKVDITLDSGARFGFWSEVEIARGLDSYTALSLSGPFDFERDEVRRAFAPLLFQRVTAHVGGERLFTGHIKDTAPSVDPAASSIGVTAYSIAHALTEINPADDLLPLEYRGLDLRQIADKLAGPAIGERPEFDGPPGAVFGKVRCEPDGKIHDFLAELATQRAFVLADVPSGAPLFRSEAKPGKPRARLRGQPIVRVTPQLDPGAWYSSVTGIATRKSGAAGSRYTEYNPLYRADNPRPCVRQLDDTESADVPRAVKALIGRMVASVVRYTIDDLPTWRDPQGALWEPNTTVTVIAPEAMIFRETELLVRAVRLRQTAESETASLELTLPGSFGGTLPGAMPWDP